LASGGSPEGGSGGYWGDGHERGAREQVKSGATTEESLVDRFEGTRAVRRRVQHYNRDDDIEVVDHGWSAAGVRGSMQNLQRTLLWQFGVAKDVRRNNALLASNGQPRFSDTALVAFALLVAESDASHKELVIRLILNLLAEDRP